MSDKLPAEIAKGLSTAIGGLLESGPSKALSGVIADRINFFRWRSAVNIAEKAREIRKKKGISESEIPIKALIPILEEGSKEEEDSPLIDMWVALLAQETSDFNSLDFICMDLIKRITANEVHILNLIHNSEDKSIPQDLLENLPKEIMDDFFVYFDMLIDNKKLEMGTKYVTQDEIDKKFEYYGLQCWKDLYINSFRHDGVIRIEKSKVIEDYLDTFFALESIGLLEFYNVRTKENNIGDLLFSNGRLSSMGNMFLRKVNS